MLAAILAATTFSAFPEGQARPRPEWRGETVRATIEQVGPWALQGRLAPLAQARRRFITLQVV